MSRLRIINYRKYTFLFSSFIIVIGIISLAVNGLNMGIDFTGGTVLHYRIGQSYEVEEVREILQDFNLEGSTIQKTGHEGIFDAEKDEVIIKTVYLSEEERREIFQEFQDRWDLTEEAIISEDNVGPVIGEELKRNAFLALLVATAAMIAYITIRFEFKFALSAIVALVHDLIILLAIFSLLRIEVNSEFVAAILTIFGYSINDTIVVFDRIRENLKVMKKDKIIAIVNESINQTITRSINTSVTTLLALTALFVFGGITLRPLITALLVGVISGTYSSIFIASPVWFTLKQMEVSGRK
ncbi:protein translocase subunit SecF [Candidatus Contubernalis alkaliaceticus]|uniref:protein translocase subunit SecF n=1 Tax=Candidatus Contubernalis alkaliaceticus TaxID=338645 RepID=UPI001F4BF188|nr:protein translocase subunit SecF [Candidatus Contubernalis alkalaceticus]UNC92894.1 protein translocase subunit SecF [Candidatus Contubernalis alkalaceticus]